MSSEWKSGRLGEFIELKRGYDLPQAKREKGSIPLISSSGHSDYHSEAKVSGPGVVTGRYGTIGQVFYVEQDFWPLNTTLYVKDFKGNDPKFIHYFLKTIDFLAYSDKAAVPGVNRNHLHEALVNVPRVNLQVEIAAFLGALDDRIALLRETNATLEAIAQALFKSWFVDFDPVHANAGTQTSSLPAEIQALFPSRLVESPQGLIPEGWEVKTIDDISEILNGFAFKSEDYVQNSDGIFVLRTTNFDDSGYAVKLEKDVYLPESFMQSHAKYLCKPYDFHLVMVGASVGHTSLLLPSLLPALRNQNMWCFRERIGFPSKFFVHEVVKMNVADALRSTSGSAREFFRKGDFGLRRVLVPDNTILEKFEEHVSCFKESVASNTTKIETLTELRDTLLPRLISGQLRLPEAEAALAEVG